MKPWTAALALATGLFLPALAMAAPVLMISIDGLRPLDVIEADKRGFEAPNLRRMMGEWVVSVESSENLVVVRTPPGCAHVVASALDRSALDGVLGSVAGDDTVLVIADEKRGGMSIAAEFRSLAGLDDSTSSNHKEK